MNARRSWCFWHFEKQLTRQIDLDQFVAEFNTSIHGALLCSVLQLDELLDSSVLLETIDYSRLLAPACSQFYHGCNVVCCLTVMNVFLTVAQR